MGMHNSLDTMRWRGHLVSDRTDGSDFPMISKSIIGITGFAISGLVVTAALLGKDVPQASMNAYIVNGQTITAGADSLDLSRPIFVRGHVPICPTQEALSAYSPSDPGGCTMVSTSAPAGLIGIVTNGMQQPTFQMQMKTPQGTVQGWVDYNNLRN